jgi:hypothetical protein
MEPEPGREGQERPVSFLGHPVTGLAPTASLSAGWILLALQFVPQMRDRFGQILIAGGKPAVTDLWPLPPGAALVGLLSLGLLLVGVALFAVWVTRARGFGPLLDRVLHRNELVAAIVFLASGVLTVALISSGQPTLGDAKTHVARGWLWHEYIRAGTFPRWTDLWYGGFPGGQHYPPLAHILQGLLDFLRLDPSGAAKQLAWFCRICGAVGFSLFCARVHRDTRAGLLGGLIYAIAPTTHAAWMWEGRLPGVVVLAILPWAFHLGERLATGIGGYRAGAGFALTVGALTLAHIGQARLAVVLLALFMLLRAIPTIATPGARAPSIAGIAIGVVGGAALAATFVTPMVRDSSFLNTSVPDNLLGFHPGLPDLGAVLATLRWNPFGKTYIGISLVLLAIGGIVRAALDRKEGGRGIGPWPMAVLFFLPWFLVPPWWRGLDLIPLGGWIAAAGIVRRPPSPKYAWIKRGRILPIALFLVLADLAPLSLVTTYGTHREARERMYAALEDRLVSGRFLELPVDASGLAMSSHWFYAPTRPVQSVGGPYIQGAPRAFAYGAAMIDTVAHGLASGQPLAPGLVDLLAIHNVRAIVLTNPQGPVAPPPRPGRGVTVGPEVPALWIDQAAPVAVLEPGSEETPPLPNAEITVSGLPPEESRRLAREQMAWIVEHKPRPVPEARAVALPNRLEIDVPDLGPVTVRIARNTYPYTEVRVDGVPWPWRAGPLGGITVDLTAGVHKIEVREKEERVRRFLRIVQWALAGLLFLTTLGPRRR